MFLASPITFPNLGITVDPSPVAFTVFGKDIYWYGIRACGKPNALLALPNGRISYPSTITYLRIRPAPSWPQPPA